MGKDSDGSGGGCTTVMGAATLGMVALCGGCLLLGFIGQQSRYTGAPATPRPSPSPTSATEARLGPKPTHCPGAGLKQLGIFTGSPPCVVELYLAKALHDPESFKMDDACDVRAGKAAWVTDCTFRARNAFGGMVLQAWRFEIRGDKLLSAKRLP